jgi:hypothetical protein
VDESSKLHLKQLCEKIAKEHDNGQFSTLVAELNMLLESLDGISKKDGAATVPSSYKNQQEERSTPPQFDRSSS